MLLSTIILFVCFQIFIERKSVFLRVESKDMKGTVYVFPPSVFDFNFFYCFQKYLCMWLFFSNSPIVEIAEIDVTGFGSDTRFV